MARHCSNCGEAGHYSRTCSQQKKEPSQAFEKISAGLNEALAFVKGEETGAIVHTPSSDYRAGLWLVRQDTMTFAGKIKKVNKETVVYDSMLGAETESSIRDLANNNYEAIDLHPSHLIYMFKKYNEKRI